MKTHYTFRISKDYLKAVAFTTVALFPLVHLALFAASPWWCIVWLLLLAF